MGDRPTYRGEPTAQLSQDAFDRLTEELRRLKTEDRTRIAERLLRAREFGDIRENAEFDAAKDAQGLMEARIRELEWMLKDPVILDEPTTADAAAPGLLVTVRLLGADPEEETYLLARSKEERAVGVRTVSMDSPFGQALIGKRAGDRFEFEAPGGTFSYEVVSFRAPEE